MVFISLNSPVTMSDGPACTYPANPFHQIKEAGSKESAVWMPRERDECHPGSTKPTVGSRGESRWNPKEAGEEESSLPATGNYILPTQELKGR